MATPVDDEWEYSPPKAQADDEWEYSAPGETVNPDPYNPESIAAAQSFSRKAMQAPRGVPLDATEAAASRGFRDAAEGVGELALDAGNAIGVVDDATLANFRESANRGRAEFAEQYGNAPGANVVRGLYGAAPYFAAPQLAARTAIGRIGSGMLTGGGIGAAQYTGEDGQRGTNILGGAAIGGALTGGVEAFNRLRPHNLVARKVDKALSTPFAKEGEKLEQATGIHLTPGQLSGDKSILMMEGMTRQHPLAASRVQTQIDEPQLQKAVENLNRMMDRMDNRGFGPSQVGNEIKSAFDNALNKALDVRRAQAAKDYGALKFSTKKQPLVGTSNIRKEIDDIVSEFDVPGGESIVNQAKSFARMIGDEPMTAEKAMKARSLYSSMARGTGQIFKDIDKSQSRMLAARLESALMKDLEAAETVGGNIGAALKAANSNYRANSLAIQELEQSTLGRLFGGKYDPDPQVVAERMLKMKPTELSTAAGILHSSNPKVMQGVKRFTLEKAMEKAIPAPSAGSTGVKFSAAKFVSALPNESALRAMYSPMEVAEIKNITAALERVANRGGLGGSQTAPLMMTWDAAKAVFTFNIPAMARLGASVIAPNKIAAAMATKEGRQAIRTVITTRNPEKAMRAAAYLATVNDQ